MNDQLISSLKKSIQTLPHQELKQYLLKTLNTTADKPTQIFTAENPYDRKLNLSGRASHQYSGKWPYEDVLNLVYAFAPTSVCNQVTKWLVSLDDNTFHQIISTRVRSEDKNSYEQLLHTFMHYADDANRKALLERTEKLKDDNKLTILFDSQLTTPKQFKQFLTLFPKDNANACHQLLLVLKSISVEKRFECYITFDSFFSKRFSGVINFFISNRHEDASLLMISMLAEHSIDELKKLVFRKDDSEYNLLHAVIKAQSAAVINKLLVLLIERFSESEMLKLLSEADPVTKETFLQTAIKRVDDPKVACAVIDTLYPNPKLRGLLTEVSAIEQSSPMHLAVTVGNSEAISTLLEKENPDIDHQTFITRKTMRELAANNRALLAVFDAFPLYQHLTAEKNPVDITTSLRANPAILETRWQNGKTLLHIAAAKGNTLAVELLLDNGANPHLRDNSNQNVLQTAVTNNQTQTTTLLVQSEKTTLSTLEKALINLRSTGSRQALERALSTKDKPFSRLLQDYYQHSNDAAIALIHESGKCLHKKNGDNPRWVIDSFLQSRFQQLSNSLFTDNVRLQLLTFLFSIDTLLLKNYATKANGEKFAQIICYGLQQPAIYSQISLETFKTYLGILEKARPNQTHPLADLVEFYCLSDDLNSLPCEIIDYLSRDANEACLKNAYEHTKNPVLLVLMLQKSDTFDEVLYKQLWSELNTVGLTDNDLILMLNLIKNPLLKQRINVQLQNSDSLLAKRLETIFANYENTSLLNNSFLRQKLISFATHFAPPVAAVVGRLLSIASKEESMQILSGLEHLFAPQIAFSSHFTPFKTTEISAEFGKWLYSHTLQAPRQRLMVLWAAVDQKASELKKLSDSPQHDDNYKALLQLANQLDHLARQLYRVYVVTNLPVLSEIQPAIDELINIIQRHPELSTLPELIELNHLTAVIKKTCKKADEQLQQHSSNTQHLHELNPGLQAFTAMISNQPVVEIENAHHFLHSACNDSLHELSRHVIRAGLNQLDNPEMFEQFSHWMLKFPGDVNRKEFYEFLTHAIQKQDANLITPFQQSINTLCELHNENLILIGDLQQLLLNEKISPAQFIEIIFQHKLSTVKAFREFCVQANCHSIVPLLDNIIAAKEAAVPSPFLTASQFLPSVACITPWMQETHDHLTHYIAHITSLKLLCQGVYCESESKSRLQTLTNSIENGDNTTENSACVLILRSYLPALNEERFDENDKHMFMRACHGLFVTKTPEAINHLLTSLPDDLLGKIAEFSLDGLAAADKIYAKNCRQMMTYICQHQELADKRQLHHIKHKLGAQDLHLLNDKHLQAIASEILGAKQSDDLHDQTINGIWIQRLITSPRFVAHCSPSILQMLIDRYRLISLTLKQDEFRRLTSVIKSKMDFYDVHERNFSSNKTHLLEKRQRLLQFRADDSVRALMTQLEDNCFELRQSSENSEKSIAENALRNLLIHHNNNLKGFRNDFFFRISNYFCSAITEDKGDLQLIEGSLASWIKNYLPHHNFTQNELASKNAVVLYNELREKVAFINEAGQVMGFINDEPCPILSIKTEEGKTKYPVNTCFYQENGRTVAGHILPSGCLERNNLFQKQTSAMLLAKVPVNELEQSKAAISPLLRDVITENQVDTFFKHAKRDNAAWLETQIIQELAQFSQDIGEDSISAIVKNHKPADLFKLLAEMPNNNAVKLFNEINKDSSLRKRLFSADHQTYFHQFLKKQDAAQLFADFLAQTNEQSLYLDGLCAFSDYARIHDRFLLVQTLNILRKDNTIDNDHYDCILTRLLDSEDACKILWHNYLDATKDSTVQSLDKDLSKHFTSFFFKHHCQNTLTNLNQLSSLAGSYQYRLFMLILAQQRRQILANIELRYSETQAWGETELYQMSLFVKRHLDFPETIDTDKKIGKKLFSDLMFRTANFGILQLFYTNDKLDLDIVQKTMKRSVLRGLVAKNQILAKPLQKVDQAWKGIMQWFNDENVQVATDNQAAIEALKAEQAIIDWQAVCDDTWKISGFNDEMPLLTAYLYNFSGRKSELEILITDYLQFARQKPSLIPLLTHFIEKLPQRDVSRCLFNKLENFYTQYPNSLDSQAFSRMANYFAQFKKTSKLKSPQAELLLIEHFGLQKKYELVKQCCQLLCKEPYKLDEKNYQLVHQVHIEAHVENNLQTKLGKWYFFLLQLFKRYFNYNNENSSQIVLFCDDGKKYDSPVKTPDRIESGIKSGQVIHHEIIVNKKFKAFKERVKPFMEKVEKERALPEIKDIVVEPLNAPGYSSCRFFGMQTEPTQKEYVASQTIECV